MMADDNIIIKGARVHNLKNIDVELPRNRLIVLTGLSGSGKSSLAFDTIYAEGQRRYVESLSAYARQFIGLMERPDVDYIEGLSPSISIEQKTVSHNPRSTVGTVTEIYDYLRLLFARVGTQFCYKCGNKVQRQSTDQIIDAIAAFPTDTKLQILAPVVRGRKGHYRELFEQLRKEGFVRVRIDGVVKELTDGIKADRYKIHTIEVIVDRIIVKNGMRSRIADSVELALRYGKDVLIVHDGTNDHLFSKQSSCHQCGISYEAPTPSSFSFNTPAGYCPACEGMGEIKAFDEKLIIPNEHLSIEQEGIAPIGKPRKMWMFSQLEAVGKRHGFDFKTPLDSISDDVKQIILYGAGTEQYEVVYRLSSGREAHYKHRFNGVMNMLERFYRETTSTHIRNWVEAYMTVTPCTECNGGRLRKESLSIRLEDARGKGRYNMQDIVRLSITDAQKYINSLTLTERQTEIARQILKEIRQRLSFLVDVGLEYITLDRATRTLAGGEGQRIRLATQIGTQLVGVLYILDEPSIGLHQRDNRKLIESLKSLRDLGNTVIVVEHDKEMILSADYVVDLGPGAGEHGGHVVMTGHPSELIKPTTAKRRKESHVSHTTSYLTGARAIEIPDKRRISNGNALVLKGASGNNLKNIELTIPLGLFVCITGVSGSGKSTLINETLYPVLARKFYKSNIVPLSYTSINGLDHIDKVVDIDQSPIGRTPRSNPATYTGLFTLIRDLFAQLPESKLRGYGPGRFSFNVKGGRCDECEGDGLRKIEMNFLPDVYVVCETCGGRRYNRETVEVLYKGKSIADVLGMTVEDAVDLFSELPRLQRKLQTLHDVGLGYIRLGQQATTLSGGEAQRVKLSTELSKIGTGKTMYILDEPTTGLHFEDIRMLLSVLNKLVDKGNTVVVIEHNLDVIKTADWIIDLGPEGGERGGTIVAEGTPEQIAKARQSFTGKYLKEELAS
jgi:excinuclease ABC subunit A